MQLRDEGFDVIGDVHGHDQKLTGLLDALGYAERDGVWWHRTRRAVFVGDLIDRGPGQVETVRIVQAMVGAGTAFVVAGNHEYNAVAFHTPDPDAPGSYLRRHSDKNNDQHAAFLDQVGGWSMLHHEIVDWCRGLPLWLDLDGVRVVHACWNPTAIEVLADTPRLERQLMLAAADRESPEYLAVEHLLKGPELPVDPSYYDKGGHLRDHARYRWWDPDADSLDRAVLIPPDTIAVDGQPYPGLPPTPIEPPVTPYREATPVVFGHYWCTGIPSVTSSTTACVDYSAGMGGPLVAYRWCGESVLTDDGFVY